jgi:hypothetical protein
MNRREAKKILKFPVVPFRVPPESADAGEIGARLRQDFSVVEHQHDSTGDSWIIRPDRYGGIGVHLCWSPDEGSHMIAVNVPPTEAVMPYVRTVVQALEQLGATQEPGALNEIEAALAARRTRKSRSPE